MCKGTGGEITTLFLWKASLFRASCRASQRTVALVAAADCLFFSSQRLRSVLHQLECDRFHSCWPLYPNQTGRTREAASTSIILFITCVIGNRLVCREASPAERPVTSASSPPTPPLTSVWPGAALIIACPIQAVSGGAQGDSIRTN